MDKLENETWDDYALRNNLFKIKFAEKDGKNTINGVKIPNNTVLNDNSIYTKRSYEKATSRVLSDYDGYITDIGFMDFILYEIYNLIKKYEESESVMGWTTLIAKVEHMTKEREEDINRQIWLFEQRHYWNKKLMEVKKEKEKEIEKNIEKYKADYIIVKNRYFELKTTLSEKHKEQLDELLKIIRGSSISRLECECVGPVCLCDDLKERNRLWTKTYNEEIAIERIETNKRKKYQIELYEKYLKNKDIQTQIIELEQKINQLKDQIVK